MSLAEIFLLALALSADAFSVAVVVGLKHVAPRQLFRLSWHFGLFQALMPFLGALTGEFLLVWVKDIDHFVACGLLEAIGAKMLWEALRQESAEVEAGDPTRGWHLIGLSLATSIDAFGAGIGLALAGANLWLACPLIGATTLTLTLLGMFLGRRVGGVIGRRAGAFGGLVLMGLGIKMLWI